MFLFICIVFRYFDYTVIPISTLTHGHAHTHTHALNHAILYVRICPHMCSEHRAISNSTVGRKESFSVGLHLVTAMARWRSVDTNKNRISNLPVSSDVKLILVFLCIPGAWWNSEK